MSSAPIPTISGHAAAAIEGPIMILGGSGMLGRAFRQLIKADDFTAYPREHLDITDPASVQRCAAGPWKTYINCAGYTDVDKAETDERRAMEVNATGVALLARTCRELGATLVHFSTDYVFDGRASEPYPTDHPRAPIGAYARSKAMGEEAIEREVAQGLKALIIRTSWLYAPWGRNFVRTIAKLCKERPTLRVVDDQRGRPTSSEHLAATTLSILARGARGTFHVTDGGECTWFEFATHIAAHENPSCRVTPCTSAEFPRPAKRPAFSVLDLSKTEALVGEMPDWKANLAGVLSRLEPEERKT